LGKRESPGPLTRDFQTVREVCPPDLLKGKGTNGDSKKGLNAHYTLESEQHKPRKNKVLNCR